jgi:hypothetical protein
MTCNSCSPNIEKFGASPINIQWCIVRGDTGTMRLKFFEPDESTPFDTDSWTYIASAYDPKTSTSYTLDVYPNYGYIDIVAQSSVTSSWGNGFGSVVADLSFDVEVTIPADGEDTIWTPVIGTIQVLGDISGGL